MESYTAVRNPLVVATAAYGIITERMENIRQRNIRRLSSVDRVTVMEEIVLSCWVNIVCFCNCKLICQRFVFKRPEEDAGAVDETTGETDYKTSQRFAEHIRKAKTTHPSAISPRRKNFNNNDNIFLVLLFVNRSV